MPILLIVYKKLGMEQDMSGTVKIGNASGFWGDSNDAPRRLLEQQPDLDYLTLDYLAELSLGIMAMQRSRDLSLGYARDVVGVIESIAPLWARGRRCPVITNAGGLNPRGCAEACAEVLRRANCYGIKIAIVSGDDVLDQLQSSSDARAFRHLETGQSFDPAQGTLISANAYLGAQGITQALDAGAQLVITGRVADPSLTVGPCAAHYHWDYSDYRRLAGATVAGHLIECGTQVTGGISTQWLEMPDPEHIGFPVVEVFEDGSCIVTKPKGTGGAVTERTVKEQLLYEIGDPARYLSPDVTASFLTLKVQEEGRDRVRVSNATGSAPPPDYKVSACRHAGYRAEGQLVLFGRDIVQKARRSGEVILQRVRDAGFDLERSLVECLGAGDLTPGMFAPPKDLREIVLRIAAADHRKEALECFVHQFAPLVTSGPQGVTGYATGRPKVRPQFAYWPCLIARDRVTPHLEFLEVT